MTSGEMDKFYKNVLKEFTENLQKKKLLKQMLEEYNVDISQIQNMMNQKIKAPEPLLTRHLGRPNQIQKQMRGHFFSVQNGDIKQIAVIEPQVEEPRAVEQVQSSDDLEWVSASLSQQLSNSKLSNPINSINPGPYFAQKSDDESEQQPELQVQADESRKRSASELSQDDLSNIDVNGDSFRKMRQESHIHILGTYNPFSRRSNHTHIKSQVTLQDVFIKVKGLKREIYLRSLQLSTQKK